MSDPVYLYTDLFPGAITPLPEGVLPGSKLRVIVTSEMITCAWLAGRNGLEPIIGRVDIPIEAEDARGANYLGGTVAGYKISRGPGCSCGSAGLKTWDAFPGVRLLSPLTRR